jgi:hypothetical protein
MKVADLTGPLLAYWVAKCEGIEESEGITLYVAEPTLYQSTREGGGVPFPYRPDYDWKIGGPIIQKDQIFIEPPHDVHISNFKLDGTPRGVWQSFETWHATVSAITRTFKNPVNEKLPGCVGRGEGKTALIAAMRAKVASHYGDEVPEYVL